MAINRRGFMLAGAAASALPARAQAFPSKPIRLVNGFSAGTPPDIISRLVATTMSERIGQQVFVDNRAGAGSNVATSQFKRAEPDGYSILLVVATTTINQTLFPNLDFHIGEEVDKYARIFTSANIRVN